MAIVNLSEARANLSQLVERAASGEEIIIARAGRPLARLSPLEKREGPRPLGLFRGQARMHDDFEAPLPEALACAFKGQS